MSVIMKRNWTFLKEERKTRDIQIISEATFDLEITVQLQNNFLLVSESNHNF